MLFCRVVLAAALIAGCGVAAPARVDLAALVKRYGPVDARHELELRIVKDPKDLAARLALAKLCEQQGRPSQAIEQLEAVIRAGGPIGTRWHDEDRTRFARLLAARGRVRTARGAPTALADLDRAREYGAPIADDERARAKQALAIVRLRHVDAKERAAGLAMLDGVPRAPGDLGVWLWGVGAKRAAYEALATWHAKAPPPRDERIQTAYLRATAWWTPLDGAPPATSELVGPERCRFVACNAWDLVQNGVSSDAIDALLLTTTKTSDPETAYAWLAITLAQSLRPTLDDDGTWAERFAARVDVSALSVDKLPAGGRAAFALVTGREAPPDASDRTIPGRYLAAGVAAYRGAQPDDIRALLGSLADTPDGAALIATAPAPVAAPYHAAVARFMQARLGSAPDPERVRAILDGYARDPLVADRLARDVVAGFADAAAGHAWVGALFDAIQDPARARASWHAAVDGSPGEPAFTHGLALAVARANDPDAALVFATQAAAASGDPSPVWIAIAETLHANGSHVHALEAARYAIDLATAETAARAFEIAAAASEALGRTSQARGLRARRAQLAPPPIVRIADADAWRAARWNPRDVSTRVALLAALPATDARRQAVIAELVQLAGDRDPERGRAAIRAIAHATRS